MNHASRLIPDRASVAPDPLPEAQRLECREIFGGTGQIDTTLAAPGVDVWVCALPHGQDSESGDLHYASVCACDSVSRFVLADVSGHGANAAPAGTLLRDLMRRYSDTPDQTAIARALNRLMNRQANRDRFATALLCSFHPPSGRLVLVNAGHPKPLHYRAAADAWSLLDEHNPSRDDGVTNLPFGIIEPTEYVQFAVAFDPGDVVVLYSDGLSEASSPSGGWLDSEALLGFLRELRPSDPAAVGRHLVRQVAEHRGEAPPQDDQTLMVLYRHDRPREAPSTRERLRSLGRRLLAYWRSAGVRRGAS